MQKYRCVDLCVKRSHTCISWKTWLLQNCSEKFKKKKKRKKKKKAIAVYALPLEFTFSTEISRILKNMELATELQSLMWAQPIGFVLQALRQLRPIIVFGAVTAFDGMSVAHFWWLITTKHGWEDATSRISIVPVSPVALETHSLAVLTRSRALTPRSAATAHVQRAQRCGVRPVMELQQGLCSKSSSAEWLC